MSSERDVNRIVRSWMEEGVTALPDHVLDAVLDQVPATPQRRSFWLARRQFNMNKFVAMGLGIAAAVVALVIVGQYLGSNVGGPPVETPTPPAPTSTQTTTVLPLPLDGGADLDPGRYYLSALEVEFNFEVPAGWFVCSTDGLEQAVCRMPTPDQAGLGLSFAMVENVVADPCGPEDGLLDPPVGPSVDDLVTAISGLQGFEATTPVDIAIDGFQGKEFTLTAPTNAGCDLLTWATALRTNGVGPGEVNVVRIVDVDGMRVLINGAYHPVHSEEEVAGLREVMDSVHVGNASRPKASLASGSGPGRLCVTLICGSEHG